MPWRLVAVWSTTAVVLALAIGVFAVQGAIPGFVIPTGGPMMGGM